MANPSNFLKIDMRGAAPAAHLYGTIGQGDLTPEAFAKAWRALGNPRRVDLFISSPGGDCFAGGAIFDIIARSGVDATVHVDGLAASMASYVAMLGRPIIIGAGAQMMIHNPAVQMGGGAADLTRGAALLESIRQRMVTVYAKRTGQTESTIAKMMDAETWMDAREAVRLGFADEIGSDLKMAATAFNLQGRGYRKVPQTIAELSATYWASKGKAPAASIPTREQDDLSDLIPAPTPGHKLTAAFHGKYAGRK